ncbi:hypothetical protein D3C77_439470 [compost metagenome]
MNVRLIRCPAEGDLQIAAIAIISHISSIDIAYGTYTIVISQCNGGGCLGQCICPRVAAAAYGQHEHLIADTVANSCPVHVSRPGSQRLLNIIRTCVSVNLRIVCAGYSIRFVQRKASRIGSLHHHDPVMAQIRFVRCPVKGDQQVAAIIIVAHIAYG